MKNRILVGLMAAAGLAGVANAQALTIDQSWRAVVVSSSYAGPGFGAFPASSGPASGPFVLNPGQSILFVYSAAVNGAAVGDVVTSGGSQFLLAGIGGSSTGLSGSNSSLGGTWSPNTIPGNAGFRANSLGSGNLINAASGVLATATSITGLGYIGGGLTGGSALAINNTQGANGLAIMWTPNAAAFNLGGTTTFTAANGQASNIFAWGDDGSGAGVALPATGTSSGSFVVQVVPAPASMALLGLGGLVAARRRRA